MKKTTIVCLVTCFCLALCPIAQAVDTQITAEEFLSRLRTTCELSSLELDEGTPSPGEKAYSRIVEIGEYSMVFTANNETDLIISLGYPVGDSDSLPALLCCVAAFLLTPEEMLETSPVPYAANRLVAVQTEIDKMTDEFEANGTVEYSDGDLVYRYNRHPGTRQITFVINPCEK